MTDDTSIPYEPVFHHRPVAKPVSLAARQDAVLERTSVLLTQLARDLRAVKLDHIADQVEGIG